MLFICATFGFFADLNLCSALNQIAPKTLSSSSDILFAVCDTYSIVPSSLDDINPLPLELFCWNCYGEFDWNLFFPFLTVFYSFLSQIEPI
jgi:hypothetical protein